MTEHLLGAKCCTWVIAFNPQSLTGALGGRAERFGGSSAEVGTVIVEELAASTRLVLTCFNLP